MKYYLIGKFTGNGLIASPEPRGTGLRHNPDIRVEGPATPGRMNLECHVPHMCLDKSSRWDDISRGDGEGALQRVWNRKLLDDYGPDIGDRITPMVFSTGGGAMRKTREALRRLAKRAYLDRQDRAGAIAARWACGAAFTIYKEMAKQVRTCANIPDAEELGPQWAEPEPMPVEFLRSVLRGGKNQG